MMYILTSGIELNDVREAAYGRDVDTLSKVSSNVILNKISLLYCGIKPLATGVSIMLLFMYKKQRSLVTFFAITTLLANVLTIVITAGRGETVITLSIYAGTLFLIRNTLSVKTKRVLTLYAVPILVISVLFFWAVTISRFGDSAQFFMYKYMGEPMNNFNGILFSDIKGYTDGRAQFSYIYRYLLGETDFTNTEGRYELMEKTNKIPAFIFYTFIGPLVMEFGKIIPIFIAIFLNRMANWILDKRNIHLGIFTIYVAFIYFYIYGIFTFPLGNFTGFMVIYLLIIYHYFKKRKYSSIIAHY